MDSSAVDLSRCLASAQDILASLKTENATEYQRLVNFQDRVPSRWGGLGGDGEHYLRLAESVTAGMVAAGFYDIMKHGIARFAHSRKTKKMIRRVAATKLNQLADVRLSGDVTLQMVHRLPGPRRRRTLRWLSKLVSREILQKLRAGQRQTGRSQEPAATIADDLYGPSN